MCERLASVCLSRAWESTLCDSLSKGLAESGRQLVAVADAAVVSLDSRVFWGKVRATSTFEGVGWV